jgi:uncharacterized protein
MAEYLYPGIYVESKGSGVSAPAGISASTGAFVGFAPRGQRNKAFMVTSWEDFKAKTALGLASPFMTNAYLAYQVFGFFQNGGQRAYILIPGDTTAIKATVSYATGLTFTALEEGAWGNDVSVTVTANGASLYDVTVKVKNVVVSKYVGVSLTSTSSVFIEKVINGVDQFVTVSVSGTITTPLTGAGTSKPLATGADGYTAINDGKLVEALTAFDKVPDANLLVIAESQSEAVISGGIAYAEKRKNCFFLADGGMNDTPTTIKTLKEAFNSKAGELHFPWIEVADPLAKVGKKTKFIPVAGHVAGAYARNDNERGIFKAPAGTEVRILGAISTKHEIDDVEQGTLNPFGINVIRSFPDTGIVLWGARTMANTYVNVERELMYIQDYIMNNTRWAAFEPNDEDLWRRIRNELTDFLTGRWEAGAYFGDTAELAFLVKCDGELNNTAVRNAGQVLVDVGVSINKPGEFIVFRVGQWQDGAFLG